MQGGSGLARHWFHGRFQASALPLVKLWAVLRSARLPEGPGSLGGLGPAANDVSSVARKERSCAAQLGIQKVFSHTLPRGETSAQIPPRTAGGLGRVSTRIPPCGRERGLESPTGAFVPFGTGQLAISFALRAAEIEIPPEG